MVLPKNAADKLDGTEKRRNKSILDELQTRRELLANIVKRLSLDMHAETLSVIW